MIKAFKIRRIVKVLRRKVEVDTQRMRGYILTTLEQLFKMSSDFALGKVETQVNEATGKQEHLSIFQRQQWASIAGYTAQVMKSLADGFDERTIDADLAKLDEMVQEAKRKNEERNKTKSFAVPDLSKRSAEFVGYDEVLLQRAIIISPTQFLQWTYPKNYISYNAIKYR